MTTSIHRIILTVRKQIAGKQGSRSAKEGHVIRINEPARFGIIVPAL